MATSQYLRSACCDAPVRLDYDPTHDEFPVRCRRCDTALGVPDRADLPAQLRADLRWNNTMAAIRYAMVALGHPAHRLGRPRIGGPS